MIKKLADILFKPFLLIRDRFVERRLDAVGEEERFTLIYKAGYWKGLGRGSLSGSGSSLESTESIRVALPEMLRRLDIQSMLDVPCGDWHWMSRVALGGVQYIGADIVDDLVRANQRKFGSANREFRKLNLIADQLPKVDLIFVRDCLVHLTEEQIIDCLRNIVRSESKYFATTTFVDTVANVAPTLKDRWRAINMTLPPFNLPEPLELLNDDCNANPADQYKRMGLWRIEDLKGI